MSILKNYVTGNNGGNWEITREFLLGELRAARDGLRGDSIKNQAGLVALALGAEAFSPAIAAAQEFSKPQAQAAEAAAEANDPKPDYAVPKAQDNLPPNDKDAKDKDAKGNNEHGKSPLSKLMHGVYWVAYTPSAPYEFLHQGSKAVAAKSSGASIDNFVAWPSYDEKNQFIAPNVKYTPQLTKGKTAMVLLAPYLVGMSANAALSALYNNRSMRQPGGNKVIDMAAIYFMINSTSRPITEAGKSGDIGKLSEYTRIPRWVLAAGISGANGFITYRNAFKPR